MVQLTPDTIGGCQDNHGTGSAIHKPSTRPIISHSSFCRALTPWNGKPSQLLSLGTKQEYTKKKKSRIWLPVTVKSLELIVPIKYLFKFHMHSTAKPQTACNPLTSLLRLPLQADLQPARPRYARSIFFCQWFLLSSVPAVGAVTLQRWTHFAPKQRKQNSVFINQLNSSWVSRFQPIFFFFFTMWPHPKEKQSHAQIFWFWHFLLHAQKKT